MLYYFKLITNSQNDVAICPNCHRKRHYGQDRENLRDKLLGYIDQNSSQKF